MTSAFARRADGRITGVVTGLADGDNVLVASVDNAREAQLTITNAPRSGPIVSGAHVTPFYCATPTPQAASGNTPGTPASGLAGTADASCNIASETKLYYRTTTAPVSAANPGGCSTGLPDPVWNISAHRGHAVPAQPAPPANGCFKPYTAGSTPADMATTTTDTGATVPFIVRVERGTINRGIYDIAVLHQPGPAVDGGGAAGGLERQGLLQLRREHRPAAPADAAGHQLDDRPKSSSSAATWSSPTA